MFELLKELPKEYEAIYEHIRLATPELEDYKEYAKNSKAPVSKEQFIDVATYIAAILIPKNLNLTDDERELLARHHMNMRIMKLLDGIMKDL